MLNCILRLRSGRIAYSFSTAKLKEKKFKITIILSKPSELFKLFKKGKKEPFLFYFIHLLSYLFWSGEV